jgi:hypothetical protein
MRGRSALALRERVSTLITRFSAGNAKTSLVPNVREPRKRTHPLPRAVDQSSRLRKGAIVWNTPSFRTSAWKRIAETCNRISAKKANAR